MPLYIILYRRSAKAGIALQVFLLVSNIAVMMTITQVLNLKAGPISVEGYYLFANTNKFWCHFGGQAIGVLIAFFYYDCVLPYR